MSQSNVDPIIDVYCEVAGEFEGRFYIPVKNIEYIQAGLNREEIEDSYYVIIHTRTGKHRLDLKTKELLDRYFNAFADAMDKFYGREIGADEQA